MKNQSLNFKFLLITFSLLILTSKYASAQLLNSHEFLGTVFIEDEKAKDVTVKVFEGNKCFSDYQTRSNGKFIFTGENEKHYTLQFEKEGFVTKRVIIKTFYTQGLTDVTKTYKFDISLERKMLDLDESLYDFPITIIEFDYVNNEFIFNEKYTKSRLKTIFSAKNNQVVIY
jgi:hypothetical protein